MYRISREGRRASGSHDHDPGSRPARYKERFEDGGSGSSAYPDKNRNKSPVLAGPGPGKMSGIPTRNPGVLLCFKATAALLALFAVRGVSACFAATKIGSPPSNIPLLLDSRCLPADLPVLQLKHCRERRVQNSRCSEVSRGSRPHCDNSRVSAKK